MKTIQAYEFKDLPKKIQQELLDKELQDLIEFEIEMLTNELGNGGINEEEYYEALGCSKNYAETTGWFVPSCYYNEHKDSLEKEVKESVNKGLYTIRGVLVGEI